MHLYVYISVICIVKSQSKAKCDLENVEISYIFSIENYFNFICKTSVLRSPSGLGVLIQIF